MPDAIWIAEFETGDTRSQGVGETAVAATRALIERWRQYAAMTGADPDLVAECRGDVTIRRLLSGRGYVLGTSDVMWFEPEAGSMLGGDDPSLADAWSATSATGFRR